MINTYEVSFNHEGAEDMWDFVVKHKEINISSSKGVLPLPADLKYRRYFYTIMMSEEDACLFVLMTSPLSCARIA